MRSRSFLTALALALPLGTAQLAAADPPKAAERGKALFMQYCAACHGASARGDGPLAEALRTVPADLTRIAERRSGHFPTADIVAFVDGRTKVAAHGGREMPVWGERFAESAANPRDRDAAASSKLRSLVDYLKTIQVQGPAPKPEVEATPLPSAEPKR